jgi:hypothetical protein
MAITQATLGIVPRDPTNFKPHPDRWSVGAFGELTYVSFASANPAATEAIDNTTTEVVAARDYRVTPAVTAGTLTVEEAGEYLVELSIADFSSGSATGNITFYVEYAPDGVTFAALDATDAGGGGAMSVTRAASTAKAGVTLSAVQHLNGRSKVRGMVTASGASGITTVTTGRFRIVKLADNNPVSAP